MERAVTAFFVGLKTSDAEPAAPWGADVARYMAPRRTGRQIRFAEVRSASASTRVDAMYAKGQDI